jgi:hypothetical protein
MSCTKNGHSSKLQFQWNPSEVPSPICRGIIFGTPLLLALTVAMDAHELEITMDRTKHLEKDNGELEAKLCSQVHNLKQSIETINHLQLNI